MTRIAQYDDAGARHAAPRQRQWTRQLHRWLSIVFTFTVIANFAAMTQGPPPAWITYAPLLPLFVLLFTGLVLFVQPYRRRLQAPVGQHPESP